MINEDDELAFDEEPVVKAEKNKNYYVKNSELYAELEKWRDTGVASEKLGEMLIKIATRYMNHPNYVRYPDSIKEEIISTSLVWMMNSLGYFKFEYKNPFAYFTQICWSCAMDYLAKHYKNINFMRKLAEEQAIEMKNAGFNTQGTENYLKSLSAYCKLYENDESDE